MKDWIKTWNFLNRIQKKHTRGKDGRQINSLLSKRYSKKRISVVGWINYWESSVYPENAAGGLGGWVNGNNFTEYLEIQSEKARPYIVALKDEIVKKGLRTTGEQHQYAKCGVPVFSDETISTFSYRAWGDLMAAIWNTEENTNKYCYMDFYM